MASKSATGDSGISLSSVVGLGLTVAITLAAVIALGYIAVTVVG